MKFTLTNGEPVFHVPYAERACRSPDCKAGLKLLDCPPAFAEKLKALGVSTHAIYTARPGHSGQDCGQFLTPDGCLALHDEAIHKSSQEVDDAIPVERRE
eukprot:4264308-Pyramimonas_sp.AAC.1